MTHVQFSGTSLRIDMSAWEERQGGGDLIPRLDGSEIYTNHLCLRELVCQVDGPVILASKRDKFTGFWKTHQQPPPVPRSRIRQRSCPSLGVRASFTGPT